MQIQTYVQLANIYEGTMSTGVNRAIAAAITGNAANLEDAFTLYILIIGTLMCCREMTRQDFLGHMLRIGGVAFLMTAEGFNTYIAVPAMTTIPAWIAETASGNPGVVAGAQQFELLASSVDHQKAAALQQVTGIGPSDLAHMLSIEFYSGITHFLLTVDFWIYEFSHLIMGVLVATLPFILFLFLFQTTRDVPLRAAQKILGIFILQIMLSIMIQIMIAGDSTFMVTIANANANGIDEQLGMIEDITVFFAFGTGMALIIPSVAAYVGGGIAMNVGGAIARAAPGLWAAGRGYAGGLGRAGSRAVARARS